MKENFQNRHILYFQLFILFILVFASKISNIHIEPIDMSYVKRILHPEFPQGGVSYDPIYHYNYVVAYVAKIFGYEANSVKLARIFWFLEQALTIVVLIKLCNFVFKGDKLTLVLVIFMYLTLKSGETDQKTLIRPFHFLAIYYFLRQKWLLSTIFTSSLFYLHIGIAIWWFVTFCFALGIMFFLNKKLSFNEILSYPFVVLILALPVILFYLIMVQKSGVNDFETKYLYYAFGSISSVVLLLTTNLKSLIFMLIRVGIYFVGYNRWTKDGFRNNSIMPIAMGVLFVYAIDFVLVDIFLNNAAIKLNLLRSIINIELFASLFFAFLIARQVRKGNIVFLAMLMILLVPNPFWVFYSIMDRWTVIHAFYAVVLAYEIFEYPISVASEKIYLFFGSKSVLSQFKKTTNWIQHFFQRPVNLAGFFVALFCVLFVTTSLTPIKTYVKSVLFIQKKTGKSDSLHKDIARFTNEKIQGNDVVLMFPFGNIDFEFYTNHKVFVHSGNLFYYVPEHIDMFQHIFENDLNYSIEKLKSGGSLDEMWRSVDEKLIRKWRKEYSITHVIRENELSLNFPVVYENEYYKVYDLRLLGNSQDD